MFNHVTAGENNEQLPDEVGQFDGLFDTGDENVAGQFEDVLDSAFEGNNAATLEQQECGESSLGHHSYYRTTNEQHQLRELTLPKWAAECRSKFLKCDTMQAETDQM